MKIGNLTLKSIKYFAQLSNETMCFHANVYWKNKKIGIVKNAGHGGCNDEWADEGKREEWNEMLAFVKEQPNQKWKMGGEVHESITNLDDLVNKIVVDFLERRDFKKLCKKWVYFKGEDYSGYYQIKKSPRYNKEAVMEHLVGAVEEQCTLINDLTFEEYTALVNA